MGTSNLEYFKIIKYVLDYVTVAIQVHVLCCVFEYRAKKSVGLIKKDI